MFFKLEISRLHEITNSCKQFMEMIFKGHKKKALWDKRSSLLLYLQNKCSFPSNRNKSHFQVIDEIPQLTPTSTVVNGLHALILFYFF